MVLLDADATVALAAAVVKKERCTSPLVRTLRAIRFILRRFLFPYRFDSIVDSLYRDEDGKAMKGTGKTLCYTLNSRKGLFRNNLRAMNDE